MNNRTLNIVLITAMVIIWGLVGRKLFLNYGSGVGEIEQVVDVPKIDFKVVQKDTFILLRVERDPFLGAKGISASELGVRNTSSTNKIKNQNIPESFAKLQWPKVKYYGFVKNSTSLNKLVLLNINNKLYRVKMKSAIDGLIVRKVFKDSVELEFKKELKFFKKE